MVIWLKRGANDLHMAQLMPLPPIISCLIKIQNRSAFLAPVYPGWPGRDHRTGVFALSCLLTSASCNSCVTTYNFRYNFPLQHSLLVNALSFHTILKTMTSYLPSMLQQRVVSPLLSWSDAAASHQWLPSCVCQQQTVVHRRTVSPNTDSEQLWCTSRRRPT